MLAGVGGIDLLLFVISAEESIKQQTREHFDICRLLRIQQGIVVLTKSDLVDPDLLELVKLEVEEFVAGSFLEGAPIVPVSAVTGAGIDALRAELAKLAAAIQPKDTSQYFRLPVDRAFSMRGFGTIVTGTALAGSVKVEEELELHPKRTRVRVRGIQTHGKAVDQAFAGQRTALNLTGVDAAEVARGMMLAAAGRFEPAQVIDCVFDLLPTAKPMRHAAPVHFHAATSEVEAKVRLLAGPKPMQPGERGYVRFLLREPVLLLPGDRFIVRMFSPVITIGGGMVLDVHAPLRVRRAVTLARLKALDGAPLADRIAVLVKESPLGCGLPQLVARTGHREHEIVQAADPRRFLVFKEPQVWLLDPERASALTERFRTVLAAFHKQNPLLPGMSKEDLRSREIAGGPAFLMDALLARSKALVVQGEVVRLATHRVTLQQDESDALARMEQLFADAGLAVPATTEVLAKSGVEAARAKSLLQLLLRDKRLLRVGEDLVYHPSAIAALRERMASEKGRRFSVPEFKDWTGVSRKYAIPLLEFLDRERVTRRDGDARVVL